MKSYSLPALMLILVMMITACAPVGISQTATPTAPVTETEPTDGVTTEPNTAGGPVDNLEGIQNATIQIEAEGSFIDPQFGAVYNVAGRGSGFFIDPSGIAVTNNHVVTGAALLKVWVPGHDKPLNARILGVSECWDLAVIDVEGEGYPYMEWYNGEIKPGLEVYTAGYPLGDPEFTLTKGIVSKANANGETSWASVDGVIEHDARIRGGNSGGPLVTADGKVVGINFAGVESTDQNFAIRSDRAQSIVDSLKQGENIETVGINGQAVLAEDGSFSGIWVSSVKSGSPADKTGIKGGDIVTTLEGLVLATDGTMADYCDILRTRTSEDVMAVEVLRYDTKEYLQGQINGRVLETSFSFANALEGEVQGGGGNAGTGSYDEFMTVQDNYGAIEITIPTIWSEVDGSAWVDGGETIGAGITAAASLENFNNSYNEPGVFFGATNDIAKLGGYIQLLDVYRDSYSKDCVYDHRENYDDGTFTGAFDLLLNCADSANVIVVLTGKPVDSNDLLITLVVNVISDADVNAIDEIISSFKVIGPLP